MHTMSYVSLQCQHKTTAFAPVVKYLGYFVFNQELYISLIDELSTENVLLMNFFEQYILISKPDGPGQSQVSYLL